MHTITRKKSAERKRQIAEAVLRLIGEQGLAALSTATIAAQVGVTPGALFRHFATVDDMLAETVSIGLQKIEGTFPDPDLPPLAYLRELARRRVELLGSDPGLSWLLRSEQAYLTLPDDAVERLRGIVRRSKNTILNRIHEGVADGSIRKDLSPAVLQVMFIGTVHALIGAAGVRRHASPEGSLAPDDVLDGLIHVLRQLPIHPPGEIPGPGIEGEQQ